VKAFIERWGCCSMSMLALAGCATKSAASKGNTAGNYD
jgi:hypothetical protein